MYRQYAEAVSANSELATGAAAFKSDVKRPQFPLNSIKAMNNLYHFRVIAAVVSQSVSAYCCTWNYGSDRCKQTHSMRQFDSTLTLSQTSISSSVSPAGGACGDHHAEPSAVQDPRLVPEQTKRCEGRQVQPGEWMSG